MLINVLNRKQSVFHYANSRSGKIIGKVIGSDYPGIIMCDGYKGYSNQLDIQQYLKYLFDHLPESKFQNLAFFCHG